jgi:galactose oxidase-like protein/Kelch motif protein
MIRELKIMLIIPHCEAKVVSAVFLTFAIIILSISSYTFVYALPPTWTLVETDDSPPSRRSHAMVYDPDNKLLVVFGGYGNGTHLGDTWIINTTMNDWVEMHPSVAPSPRAATVMLYDPDQQQMILFGGFAFGHSIVSNETWGYSYSRNTWTNLQPMNAPSERASYGMAYDSTRKQMILFGGFTESGYFNDLWVYTPSENSWIEVSISGSAPSPRGAMGFVYDRINDNFIMFGGFSERGFFNDTWIFDAKTKRWTHVEPIASPPPLRTRMIFDETSGKAILFGGDVISGESEEPSPKPYSKTWAYDSKAKNWAELLTADSPGARSLNGLAFDSARRTAIIFGGTDSLIDQVNFVGHEFNDLWEFPLADLDSDTWGALPFWIFPIGAVAAVVIVFIGFLARKNH